jgi:hypothetical protein
MFLPTLIIYIVVGFVFFQLVMFGLGVAAERNEPNIPHKKYHLLLGIFSGVFWLILCIYFIIGDKETDSVE